jgi:hypothetical protein
VSSFKRFAAKDVRNYKYFEDVSNGGWYKKLFKLDDILGKKHAFYSDKELRSFVSQEIKNVEKEWGCYEMSERLRYVNRYLNSLFF